MTGKRYITKQQFLETAQPLAAFVSDLCRGPNEQWSTVWRWDQQEPFGVKVPYENPPGLGAFEFPLRFPGQYFDRETSAQASVTPGQSYA